jgi:hypothetical protein
MQQRLPLSAIAPVVDGPLVGIRQQLLALNGVATASFVAALSASRRYTAGALMLLERYGQRELERLLNPDYS